MKLAHTLRNSGDIKVELELSDRKLKRSLNYASKENIPYVLIVGEDEIKTNTAVLRNMNEGTEEKIQLASIEDGTIIQYIQKS
ncbi:His/Gly/Thr/Pro-type tRNA ligase C-terminal domain-containing protein [Bacillus manliponensis]|uniref:His/Gly/Thr/Pro-type tRNA ligase C-terminal domain-containing protein n=1 Tax=Bacillus manliponensis TaxID=574376 RepID=UPI003515D76C